MTGPAAGSSPDRSTDSTGGRSLDSTSGRHRDGIEGRHLDGPVDDADPGPVARPGVTVVVPVYNEADFLAGAVDRLLAEMAQVEADVVILFSENGSTDGTQEVIRELQGRHDNIEMINRPEANYGAAIRAGFLTARSEWVVCFDIDYFSGAFLSSAMKQRDRADVVVASKRAPGSEDRRSPIRRLATWTLNALLRSAIGLQVSDTHGMKALRSAVLDDVLDDVVSVDDLFDTELIARAERRGFRIVELPVVVEETRASKSKIWSRVPRTVRGIWRLRRAMGRRG